MASVLKKISSRGDAKTQWEEEVLSRRHQGTKGENTGSKNLLAEAESRGHSASKASDVRREESLTTKSAENTEGGAESSRNFFLRFEPLW